MRYPESESSLVELKRELPSNQQIIKTVIGFCNSYGGRLVIGVEDNRSIKGLSNKDIEDAMEKVDQAIFEACVPHIMPRLYIQRFGDKSVLIIEVFEGMNKPYYRRSLGITKGTYIRLGRHTLQANEQIIQELKWQSSGVDYERLPIFEATTSDLDEPAIIEFLKNRKNHGSNQMTEQILRSYDIITYDQSRKYPSVLGLLLFGKDPQQYFSEAMIICSHFKGVSGRETIATVDCMGTVFHQIDQAFNFVIERLHRSFAIKEVKRKEILEIPEVAIREALLNMIVHRNYHLKSPAKIAIYEDRIEFFSPGKFPGPILIENIQSGITYLRNPAICKILREANYVEKLGSGFIVIFESCEKAGLKKPQVLEGENYIKCILFREKEEIKGKTDLEMIREIFYQRNEISVNDVINKLSISRATAIRRLNEMIKLGIIKKVGKTKNIRYHLLKK